MAPLSVMLKNPDYTLCKSGVFFKTALYKDTVVHNITKNYICTPSPNGISNTADILIPPLKILKGMLAYQFISVLCYEYFVKKEN